MKRMHASRVRSLSICAIGLAVVFLAACDDGDRRDDASARVDPTSTFARDAASSRPGFDARRRSLDGVRARADAAFAAMEPGDATRSETRIGPQQWPADLPTPIAPPADARVLADSRRAGERLLLVDVPGSVDRAAAEFGEALRAGGYRVSRVDTRRIDRTLYARDAELGEAVLTFTARGDGDGATRVEILFLAEAGTSETGRDG